MLTLELCMREYNSKMEQEKNETNINKDYVVEFEK